MTYSYESCKMIQRLLVNAGDGLFIAGIVLGVERWLLERRESKELLQVSGECALCVYYKGVCLAKEKCINVQKKTRLHLALVLLLFLMFFSYLWIYLSFMYLFILYLVLYLMIFIVINKLHHNGSQYALLRMSWYHQYWKNTEQLHILLQTA